ncbi:hypothetical protein [Nocardia sp. NPDC052566]|uniref:hypothetical protein n=1 Tax=Nocardia sp. NPDC052566 TaxID=3364330 RepID=UPI0037C90F34
MSMQVAQPDGKIVTVASTDTEITVARQHPDGSPDTYFGVDGTITTVIGDGARAAGIAWQPDGRLVAAASTDTEFAIIRYNIDGSRDRGFGSEGVARKSVGKGCVATDIEIEPDGSLLVTGMNTVSEVVARFSDSGQPR